MPRFKDLEKCLSISAAPSIVVPHNFIRKRRLAEGSPGRGGALRIISFVFEHVVRGRRANAIAFLKGLFPKFLSLDRNWIYGKYSLGDRRELVLKAVSSCWVC